MSKNRARKKAVPRDSAGSKAVSLRALAPFAEALDSQAKGKEKRKQSFESSLKPQERQTHDDRLGPGTSAKVLHVTTVGCDTVAEAEPQGLGMTYFTDAPTMGPSRKLKVRFTGKRLNVDGTPGPNDTFALESRVDSVLPGMGRIAVTGRALNITPGEWQVNADATFDPGQGSVRRPPPGSSRGATVFAPVVRVRAPGVRLGAWPTMVALGAIVGVSVQALLAFRSGLPAMTLTAISVVACLLGVVGAKVYHRLTHLEEKSGLLTVGMSLQGFVLSAFATLIVGSILWGVPVGEALDVAAPALLLGAAIGRLGCFFGGCCAGRPTASRWGVWSSNRSLGIRRIPVQFMDSVVAGSLGMIGVTMVATVGPSRAGAVFVSTIAAYIFGRQVLFPLRDVPRQTAHGRVVMLFLAAGAVVAGVALEALTR
jgi:phosphatidylglycerol:prolipoprotein diacylglycerol transferase